MLQQSTSVDAFYSYGQPTQIRIGRQYNGPGPFTGWIREITVYRRALTFERDRRRRPGPILGGEEPMSCHRKVASFGCDLWACSTVTTLIQGLVLLAVTTPSLAAPPEPKQFEVAAWVDHFDFYRHFDTEKSEGLAAILDHVQQTGATTILWRNCGGANMRYQSKVESHHHDSQVDKRRVSDIRQIGGWVRYGEAEPDIVAAVVRMCRQRGLKPGIHWPYEETHWSGWTIGGLEPRASAVLGPDGDGTTVVGTIEYCLRAGHPAQTATSR